MLRYGSERAETLTLTQQTCSARQDSGKIVFAPVQYWVWIASSLAQASLWVQARDSHESQVIIFWSSIGCGATGAAASIRVSLPPVPCLPTTLPNEVG